MPLTEFQRELCESSPFHFTDLRALYVNCTRAIAAGLEDAGPDRRLCGDHGG